jgi:aerobic carbon-monoxide dehydrogenase large subunit
LQGTATQGLVGRSVRKQDGAELLTGRARFTADVSLPGMLHAELVRSPYAHARIVRIDAAGALALPGVRAVVTGEDMLGLAGEIPYVLDPAAVGGNHAPLRCLAVGKAVYAGEPVAAVIGVTLADAAVGAGAVEVTYEPLPVVLDAAEALAETAPLVYEEWGTNLIVGGEVGCDDFADAAAGAALVLDGEVRAHRGNAAPIEPRADVADWDPGTGRLMLYATTQNPHPLRSMLATMLGLAEHRIHVIAPRMGGSFGLKGYGNREHFLVCVLARLAGGPVKWVEDRASSLLAGGREQVMRYRVACDGDGRLLALDVDLIANHGAVTNGDGWGMAYVSALTIGAGYSLEHCHVTYRIVATNKGPWGGTRPYGKDGAALLMERVIDRVAEATGIDPSEVRRRNFLRGDCFPHVHTSGLELDSGDYPGALDQALARLDYPAARAEQAAVRSQGCHLGIGLGFELVPENSDVPGTLIAGYDTSTVRMSPSGEVTVLTGVTNPGGGSDTGIAQLVAHELGLPLSDVRVVQGDTDLCPYGFGNISSRAIVTGGSAAILAARDVANKLRTVAAGMLESNASEVALGGGLAAVRGEPARTVPIATVAHAVFSLGYLAALEIEPNLEATRTFRPAGISQIPDERGRTSGYSTFPYAMHASVVELDGDTGVVTVRRHVVVHDCGTVINPMFVRGQVAGGAVMGISSALGEEFVYDDAGNALSTGFKTYLLARAADIPAIEVEHRVTPTPITPFGGKGVGEAGFAGGQAAVLNAVNDALRPLGAVLDRLPASPVNVLAAITGARR